MPAFKPKSAKKIKFNKKSSITLDGKHKEFLNEFSKDENDRIPDLQIEKYELKELLKKTLSQSSNNWNIKTKSMKSMKQ